MTKSLLKTKIVDLLGAERNNIHFIQNDDLLQICTDEDSELLGVNSQEDSYCCGILQLGETSLDEDELLSELADDEKNDLLVDCMNQIYKMAKKENPTKGIATWSHTDDNDIVIALKSEYNTEDMPWKLVSEFRNPNSGNTVCYFIAELVN